MNDNRIEVSRKAWWKEAPKQGVDPKSVDWGYVIEYADGSFGFDNTRPSDEEILMRLPYYNA